MLHQRSILVSHETLREWCLKFGPRFAEELCQGELQWGPPGFWTRSGRASMVSGTGCGALWTSMDSCRASSFSANATPKLQRRSCPDFWVSTMCQRSFTPISCGVTGQLSERSPGWPTSTISRSSPRCAVATLPRKNTDLPGNKSEADKRGRPRPFCPRSQQGFRRQKRAREFLSLHARATNLQHYSQASVSAPIRRQHQKQHRFQTWSAVAAGVA